MTIRDQIRGLYSLKEYLMENPIELNGHKSLPITLIDYAIRALKQEPGYYPACEDCREKMDAIRKAYDDDGWRKFSPEYWECKCGYHSMARIEYCPNCGRRNGKT